jgi:hypothetical protein
MAGQNSEVKRIGDIVRPKELGYNSYSETKPYSPSHPNALSDGDRIGRGDFNGAVGTIDDIAARMRQLMINRYSETNPYYVVD